MIDVDHLRETEFPATRKAVHMKAAGGSPMCRSAFAACEAYLKEMCFEGDLHYAKYLDQVEDARQMVAESIGAEAGEVGFTVNSSSSATVVTRMLRRAGVKRVYYPVGEFPTSVHAIRNAGIEANPVGSTDFDDGAADWLAEADRHLSRSPAPGKCALVASHVCYLHGVTLDIPAAADFCREREMLLVVNATQSFGALSIDVRAGVDMLYATGLKWLSAGYGAGFLCIRQSLVDDLGLPEQTGWLSVTDPHRMDNTNTAPIQEARSLDAGGGFPHFGPLLSLQGALSVYKAIGEGSIRSGIASVQERTVGLAARLRTRLEDAGYRVLGAPDAPQSSGIVSVVTADAPALFERLRKHGIWSSLRTHPHTGVPSILRFGIHFFNTKNEIEMVLKVLSSTDA